eukprot:11230097-Karenia_brevis.AAC.1
MEDVIPIRERIPAHAGDTLLGIVSSSADANHLHVDPGTADHSMVNQAGVDPTDVDFVAANSDLLVLVSTM